MFKFQCNSTENTLYIVLTLYIQCSSIGGSISKVVVRHTSVFSAVCPVQIRYSQLLFLY